MERYRTVHIPIHFRAVEEGVSYSRCAAPIEWSDLHGPSPVFFDAHRWRVVECEGEFRDGTSRFFVKFQCANCDADIYERWPDQPTWESQPRTVVDWPHEHEEE